jgi:hypothetical protein
MILGIDDFSGKGLVQHKQSYWGQIQTVIQIIKVNGFLTREESQEKSYIWVFFYKVWRQLDYGSDIFIHKGIKKIAL